VKLKEGEEYHYTIFSPQLLEEQLAVKEIKFLTAKEKGG